MKNFHRVLSCAAILLVVRATAAPLYTENGGVVDIEAEGASNNIVRDIGGQNFTWTESTGIAGSSGSYLQALPNNGVNQTTTWTNGPQLDYAVSFNVAGQHYIWIRGYGETGNDDSIHAGLNGTTNTAAGLTLSQTGVWNWSTNRIGFATRGTINASVGVQTLNLWMREDGMRIDRVLLTTNINFQPTTGNVFHIPSNNSETNAFTMRTPLYPAATNTPVFLFTGNQFQGAGNPGNQLQTGSTIFYRNATNATWSSVPMLFWFTNGNNKYYSNAIPTGAFNFGDTIQYYFKLPYDDHLPTYLYGNDFFRANSELESAAQADPFAFTIAPPLQPSGGYVAVTNGGLEARVYQNTGHIVLTGPDLAGNPFTNAVTFEPPAFKAGGETYLAGRVLAATPFGNGLELVQAAGTTSIVAQLTFPYDNVMRYEVVNFGGLTVTETSITAPSDSSEHFYGFGEKFNSLDQAGKLVHMITDDPPGSPKGDRSYKVAPWFVSTRGYGFHLDSSAESWFDMRSSASDRYSISNLFSTLKFNVVYGPKLTDVLSRYTGYSGRPKISPAWAYAPWMSSDIWHTGGEVRYLLSKYRERGIPGSVLVFDSPWEVGYNDFTWNTTQWGNSGTYEGTNYSGFASVGDMMTFIRTNGFYVICWMTPFINVSSVTDGVGGQNAGQAANYAEGAASNYFVRASQAGPPLVTNWWKGSGSPVDYTNPNAALWAQKQLSNLVAVSQSGGFNVIGGFKTDDGESGNPPGSYIPKTAVYFDGRTGQEMQNGYAVEYHKTIWNVLGTNGILFARSGFAGSQAYSGYWAGDNEPNFSQNNGLLSVIVAAGSSAMSGFSTWSSDIGGYQNTAFETDRGDLFRRWTQFGAFSPLMQMHRQVNTGNLEQFPWGYGDLSLTNYINFAKLHTALFPYIYSYATEASTNGLPIIRPLVLLNQTDANVYGVNHTYYFGNELLVAPMNAAVSTSRNVYMPAGVWFDYFTNQRYIGGSNIVWSNSNLLQMPLFVREGGIIPMISTNVMTLCDSNYVANPNLTTIDNSLEFLVYPTTNSSFTVYDGTVLNVSSNNNIVTATLTSMPRPIKMRFHGGPAFGVERDGVRLTTFTNANGFVEVTFNHTGGTAVITFGPDQDGDGLPGSWEQYWGVSCASCDDDGDGLSNLQEYLAGTNPNDAANFLQVVSTQLAGGNFTVNFSSVAGMKYLVQYSDDLPGNSWLTLSNNVDGTGGSVQILDTNLTGVLQRFYRARLLP